MPVAKKRSPSLSEFHIRYATVLEAVARRVHHLVERGRTFTPTVELARWIAHDLPTMYRQTFGRTAKPLKTWRVLTMLSNANYLGAYEDLDIRAVRGKGLTTAVAPRKRNLTLIQGGKKAS